MAEQPVQLTSERSFAGDTPSQTSGLSMAQQITMDIDADNFAESLNQL